VSLRPLAAQACQGRHGTLCDAPETSARTLGALTLTQENQVASVAALHASNFGGETGPCLATEIGG
jgi:hypothetical protein